MASCASDAGRARGTPGALLTVVVPCYNLEAWVASCLRSVFRQPHPEALHVLVVDDGSTDGTRKVVLREVAAHPAVRCELLTQANAGVSAARNAALARVRTPYVTFLDGDDLWAGDYLRRVLPALRDGRADIVAYNAVVQDPAGRRVLSLRSHGRGVAPEDLAADAARLGEWHACTRVFRTRLLDGIAFPKRRCYEDAAVVPVLYARAAHIATLDAELYVYRQRPGSLTSSVGPAHVEDLLLNAREAAARAAAGQAGFWSAVHRRTLLQAARAIGRLPGGQRRAVLARAWAQARAAGGAGFLLAWLSSLADASARTGIKALLGWRRGTPARPASRRAGVPPGLS